MNKKLNWRRIILAAGVVAVAAFTTVALPLVRQAFAEREAKRIEAKYAAGLSPCEFYPNDIDGLLQKHLPAVPTASVTVMPSFSDPVAIRLVGQELYYFVLSFPLYELGDKPRPKFNTKGVPTIYRARVSDEIARQLPLVLGNDIKNAQAELPLGLDGTIYYFQASPGTCAMAWSPDTDTRAGKFTDLFEKLAKHAQSGNQLGATAHNEQEILTILRSLQP